MSALESLLKDLEEKANAATPGTRKWDEDLSPDRQHMTTRGLLANGSQDVLFGFDYHIELYRPDAEFIAAANPDTIKKLIAVIKTLSNFHTHIDTQIEIYKEQRSMSDAQALVPVKRMFQMVLERAEKIVSEK